MNKLNKVGKELLLDLLNRENGTAFSLADITFSNPQVIENPTTFRNTKVVLSAKPGGQYVGTRVVDYHRIDIAALLKEPYRRVIGVGVTISSDLVPILNTRFGLQLIPSDIVLEPVDTTTLPVTYRLKMTESCYAFIGEVDLSLINDLPDLDQLITVNLLDGFHYPSEPAISNAAPEYVTQAGMLLVGTNLEGNKMTLGVNDEAEVFVGTHASDVGIRGMVSPIGDLYTLEINDSEDWSFTFGAALLEEGRGNDLVNLYDLKITMTLDNESEVAESVVFALVKDVDNRLVWSLTAGLPDITNSASQQRYMIQTTVNASTLSSAFPSATLNSAGAPLGNFNISVAMAARNAIYVNDIHYAIRHQVSTIPA